MKRFLFLCLFLSVIISCRGLEIIEVEIEAVHTIEDSLNIIDFTTISLDSLQTLSKLSKNRNKSIGIFGGSYTIYKGSEIVKESWANYLDDVVTDYGQYGYGFSSDQGSIQDEVNGCDIKDIYVLWASTNDFRNNRIAGEVTDYTKYDNFNENKRVTQCGGINYCIKRLREKNPDCLIVMISSSIFIQTDTGYDESFANGTGETLARYVELQNKCCQQNGVPFLNLLSFDFLKESDFREDGLHYYPSAYEKLVIPTTVLIAQPDWFL